MSMTRMYRFKVVDGEAKERVLKWARWHTTSSNRVNAN